MAPGRRKSGRGISRVVWWVRAGGRMGAWVGRDAYEISARGTGKLYLGLRCDTVLEEPAGLPGVRGIMCRREGEVGQLRREESTPVNPLIWHLV